MKKFIDIKDYKVNDEDILSFDNLYYSSLKCKRGVTWKKSVAYYMLNQLEETYKLYEQLHDGTYKERQHKQFKIYEPKERDVLSIAFRDRVYQRTLNDLVIYPKMTKSFIYDNGACQKNKGTDFARSRLKILLRRYYLDNHTNNGYIIHIDIKKYYPTMSHRVAENLFHEKLPSDIFHQVQRILKMYKGDKGYFAGSQLIQILGISILDKVDHYIKEQLHVKYYVRYMDDLILVVKDHPEKYLDSVIEELNKLEFNINTDKTKITKLYKGDTFLGFKFVLTKKGKVLQCISTQNIKRRKRKLRSIKYQTPEEMEKSFSTWESYAEKSSAKKKIKEVRDYYEKLKKDRFT